MTEDKENIEVENCETGSNAEVREEMTADAASKEQVDSLLQQVMKAQEDAKEYKDKAETAESKLATTISQYIRLQADFDNFRRRTRENDAKMTDTVKAKTLKEFLPIIDNFEMALVQIKKSDPGDAFIQGVELLLKQFIKILNDSGAVEMEAQGKPFDPRFHEAVMQITSDEWEDDTVSMVLKKGYMYKDTVLRPASVQVSHKS